MNRKERIDVLFTVTEAVMSHEEGNLQHLDCMAELFFDMLRTMIESDNMLYMSVLDIRTESDEYAGMDFLKILGHSDERQK